MKDGKYLLGGILIGDADNYNMLLQTVNNKLVLPADPEDIMFIMEKIQEFDKQISDMRLEEES